MEYSIFDKENDRIIKLLYDNLNVFNDIYNDSPELEFPIPESGEFITVFCKGTEDEGFLINLKSTELGFDELIARKWILHSKLEELLGETIY